MKLYVLNAQDTASKGWEKEAGRQLVEKAAREAGLTAPLLRKNRYGKPYVANRGGTDFYFNLSHSHRKAVLLADSSPVGVDVEYIRPIDLEVARKFATEEERAWISGGQTETECRERFFLLWTLKEAYIKAEGKGFSLSMKTVSFTLTPGADGVFAVISNRRRWHFAVCLTEDGYALATAVRAYTPRKKERDPRA